MRITCREVDVKMSQGSPFVVYNHRFIIHQHIGILVQKLALRFTQRYNGGFVITHAVFTFLTKIDLQKRTNIL